MDCIDQMDDESMTVVLELAAFIMFSNDQRKKVRKDFPQYDNTAIAQEVKRRWYSADPDVIAKYITWAEEGKEEYKEVFDMMAQQQLLKLLNRHRT